MFGADEFRRVIVVDTEYTPVRGGIQRPVSVAWHDLVSGDRGSLWLAGGPVPCPYPIDDDTLFVAHTAQSEWRTHLAMGWPLPRWVYDTLVVEKWLRCGLSSTPKGLAALYRKYVGEPPTEDAHKQAMQQLCADGGPFSSDQRQAILRYNESDVDMTTVVYRAQSKLASPWAPWHGRFTVDVARMEHVGLPVDVERYRVLEREWDDIKSKLIKDVAARFPVFEGYTIKESLLDAWLAREGIPWERLPSGRLKMEASTFKDAATSRPKLWPLYYAKKSLGQSRAFDLPVGPDGRHRPFPDGLAVEDPKHKTERSFGLRPFTSWTTRNQPSSTGFLFGLPAYLRSFLVAPLGRGLAYIDFKSQEFAIAAALSGDDKMIEAYRSGDPYLSMGVLSGYLPADTFERDNPKQEFKVQRDLLKPAVLGIQYGMGAAALDVRLEQAGGGDSDLTGRDVLRLHERAFPRFWEWREEVQDRAAVFHRLYSAHGWRAVTAYGELGAEVDGDLHERSPTSVMNWPIQTRGAEMLRLAIGLCHDVGVTVVAPVHDAVLIEADVDQLREHIELARACMVKAGEMTIGMPVGVDSFEELVRDGAVIVDPAEAHRFEVAGRDGPVRPGYRFRDRRGADDSGRDLWDRISELKGWPE